MIHRRVWSVASYDKDKAFEIASLCGADPLAVLLLQTRGVDTASKVTGFLASSSSVLSSPFEMKDMEKAANRIIRAVDEDEKILIYGDYDADGITATAILYSHLEALGARVSYYIPSRLTEGYGLSEKTAMRIAGEGYNLVITVDNGIASVAEAEIFRDAGIDFIVTDHHRVGEVLPDAYAVVDPHRADDKSPCTELCGAGIALKLVAALEGGDFDSVFAEYGDLAAIGTVADIVPLAGENRTIVLRGLEALNSCCRPGLMAMISALGLADREITSSSVAFMIAPKINAAGRMDSPLTALKLLLTDDYEEGASLYDQINAANSMRQTTETEITAEAEKYLSSVPGGLSDSVLVAAGEDWHPGVIGIVASRLCEKYGKPAVVITKTDSGAVRGSARSIEGLSLYDALKYCGDTLVQFGGHTGAAGFSIEWEKIPAFRKKINEYASALGEIFPVLSIDMRLNPARISAEILESLSLLEPFGAENPVPVFGLFGMRVGQIKPLSGGKHIKIGLVKDNVTLPVLSFGTTPEQFPYVEDDRVDAAVRIEENEYMGEKRLSIKLVDIRPADSDDRACFRSLRRFAELTEGNEIPGADYSVLLPDRDFISGVYRFVREKGSVPADSFELTAARCGLPTGEAGKVAAVLSALNEIGVLSLENGRYSLSGISGKADLMKSELLIRLGYGQ